jgi:phosphoserine phosphatase
MVLAKFNLFSNKTLKNIGVTLFLKGLNKKIFTKKCKDYQSYIEFNQLYKNLSFEKNIDYYIVSASFEEYLQPLFPLSVNILGSTIEYKNGIVDKMGRNCYKDKKVDYLKKLNVNKIDTLFTDSFSDYPLATIANNIIIVTGDKQKNCKDINEFKKEFNR